MKKEIISELQFQLNRYYRTFIVRAKFHLLMSKNPTSAQKIVEYKTFETSQNFVCRRFICRINKITMVHLIGPAIHKF